MFFSRTCTLTSDNHIYTLADLMNAVYTADGDGKTAPHGVSELGVTPDDGNTATIYMGDPKKVSSTDYGVPLPVGSSHTEGAGNVTNSISTGSIGFISTSAGQKLHLHTRVL